MVGSISQPEPVANLSAQSRGQVDLRAVEDVERVALVASGGPHGRPVAGDAGEDAETSGREPDRDPVRGVRWEERDEERGALVESEPEVRFRAGDRSLTPDADGDGPDTSPSPDRHVHDGRAAAEPRQRRRL